MSARRAAARLMRFAASMCLGVLLLGAAAIARADDTPVIPEPSGFVNDQAGVMDEPSRARLEALLDQLKQKTGAEFAVLTIKTTAPLVPEEYKVKVFARWGLGRAGADDGLLMLVVLDERVVRFETGYGLEGTLPDGLQSRIFRDTMRPRFRDGDYAGGITAGALECAARIAAEKGVTLEWNGRELRYRRGSDRMSGVALAILLAILFFFIIPAIVASRSRRGRRRRWYWGGPGNWGGGWGGGFGGGWGGGGSSGGGGSFGGFGGGSSGGGGGGGSW